MSKLALSMAIVLGVFAFSEGLSNASPYSIVGAACVPVDTTIQNGTYVTGGFGVKGVYNSTARFICNIEDATNIYGYFYIEYWTHRRHVRADHREAGVRGLRQQRVHGQCHLQRLHEQLRIWHQGLLDGRKLQQRPALTVSK